MTWAQQTEFDHPDATILKRALGRIQRKLERATPKWDQATTVIRERNQLIFELKQAQRLHQEAIRIIERKTAEPMVLREPPVTRSRPVSRMDDDKTPKKAGVLIRTENPRAHERGPRGLDASRNSAVHKKFRDGTGQATVSKCDFARPNTSQRQPRKRWDNALEGTRR